MPDTTSINPQGSRQYTPNGSLPSSIGPQIRTDFYKKKALMEASKEAYFGQMADTTAMPKHMGKKIKQFHYLPLLDDANINDQGIDANGIIADGALGEYKVTVSITEPDRQSTGNGYVTRYFVGEDLAAATALLNAQNAALVWMTNSGWLVTNYADTAAAIVAAGGTVDESTEVPNTGNLYGSSKDVGYIQGKMPTLSETGGRVNRVGFKRIELEGEIHKYGFFDEYTQESLDFDSDAELEMHINREMVMGANEMTEDLLQIDLLYSAGVVRYGANATSKLEINGDTANESLISYEDLMRISIELDDNRCPKNTKIISGSRMIDTRVIDACRYLYIGHELIPQIKRMKDLHTERAFISVEQYAAAGNIARGEIGAIDDFRVIVVPEMMHFGGEGAEITANAGFRTSLGINSVAEELANPGVPGTPTERYDVHPMLVVGSGSFTTVGFQTDGKTVKFTIVHKKPGKEIASRDDPYGEVGFMSIKWYYGFMLLRPERIAIAYTVAEL